MDVTTFLNIVVPALIKLVATGLVCLVTSVVLPWLKEQRIWTYIKKLVDAADKLAETGDIEKGKAKLNYVVNHLAAAGIKVDSTTYAWIEAAVREADIAADKIKDAVKDAATDAEE